MAYNLKTIPTVDLRPSTGVGVKIPFSSNSVFTTVYSSKEQVKYNIINYLLTDTRERPLNPGFGAGLRSKIFEQINQKTEEEIKISLTSKLQNTFPYINIRDFSIEMQPSLNSIQIKFSYEFVNTKETDDINLTIQNG